MRAEKVLKSQLHTDITRSQIMHFKLTVINPILAGFFNIAQKPSGLGS